MTEAPEAPALGTSAEADLRFSRCERANIAPTGKRFSCRFIEPGLISYRDVKGGVDLVKKETLDLCLESMIGAALTVGHPKKDLILAGDFSSVSHGKVDTVGYDPASGWFTCEGTVETEEARRRIMDGEGVSSGFTVLERANGGIWHQLPYTQEPTRIKFHHLAIVPNPRIEEADIRLNSKKTMSFIGKLIQRVKGAGGQTTERTIDLTPQTNVLIDGKPVSFADMIALQNERANAIHMVGPEDFIEHEGQRYKCTDLVDCWKQKSADMIKEGLQMRENAGAETPEQKKAREDAERANATSAEARKNEAQAAIDQRIAEERTTREREERENAARGQGSFKTLHEAATKSAQVDVPDYNLSSSGSLDDGVALGRERYGRPVQSRTTSTISGKN